MCDNHVYILAPAPKNNNSNSPDTYRFLHFVALAKVTPCRDLRKSCLT